MHMKFSNTVRFTLLVASGLFASQVFAGDSILVDAPRGVILKLTKTGAPACGTLDWDSIRIDGSFSTAGKTLNIKEKKLPLSQQQWSDLLTRVVGNASEITIIQAWPEAAGGLAASLRVAYDIRSHGGTAWVLNGGWGDRQANSECAGQFQFTGKPQKVYMTDAEFWEKFQSGHFLDARGKEAEAPAAYTWVMGSPRNAHVVEPSSLIKNGKVEKDAAACKIFNDVSVVGCDSIHKTMLAVEVAKFNDCATQPAAMPYWGLTGLSRDEALAKKVWGENLTLNPKRSGNWAM